MKKSVWIFLFAVLLPSAVLGWLALRSAEEQQIVFERRTAELYQKETEALAVTVRDTVEAERRVFGETVHRLLAKGDAEALARDFANTLIDAWPVKAVGFAINKEGKLVSPSVTASSKNPEWRQFLLGNGSFLTSTEPAMVYNYQGDNQLRSKADPSRYRSLANNDAPTGRNDESQMKAIGKDVQYGIKPTGAAGGKLAAANGAADGLLAQDKDRALGDLGLVTQASPAPAPEAAAGGMIRAARPPADAPMKPGTAEPQPVPSPLARGLPDQMPAAHKPMEEKAKSASATAAPPLDAMRRMESAPGASSAVAGLPAAKADDERKMQSPAPGPGAAGGGGLRPDAPMPYAKEGNEDRKSVQRAAPLTVSKAMATKAPQSPPPMPQAAVAKKSEMPKASAGESEAPADSTQKFANLEKLALNSINRQVEPQQLLNAPGAAVSTIMPETAEFRSLTEEGDEGMVARFVQDKLNLIFWLRPPEAPEMVFGCLVEAGHFSEVWKDVLERHRSSPRGGASVMESQPEFVLALLDDRGKPVATRPASAEARDWKRPFVASEIGEALPHWEAALYLASPTALAESARGLWRTLAFTIAGMVTLIALGGWLVVADARRQLALAQQKTDFVSNVSHELKTPLTSIRMFAELMHDRPQPAEKQGQYLRIITVEAERLTRLINNVLDFAKIGRKQKRFEKKPFDLHAVVARVWESQELHLREAGFTTRWEAAPGPYPVLGDDDALAQVLVNLLSNAEKYSTERKEVELHTWFDDHHVDIAVMDRGMGVPNGDDRKIFEAFYRAHDSLNSGIQGSGLGLTLAQRIAHEHGGEIQFERREGGGCRFTLRLPLAGPQESGVRDQGSGSRAFPDS
jgi:signal transduction histidine kinase